MRTIRDCNVVVVGGAGFLGSHLVEHLVQDRGCRVLVIDNLLSGFRYFIHPKAEFVHHDITRSESYIYALLRSHKAEYVFNYAAWPYVPDSYYRPIAVADVNFMGAMHVVNAAQEAGAKAVLQVSSAEVYGNGYNKGNWVEDCYGGDVQAREHYLESIKLGEDAPVIPHSSYGAAKAAIDAYCQVTYKERGTPVIALRQFNCVGERETHPYVVPEIISQLARQQSWTDYGMTGILTRELPGKTRIEGGRVLRITTPETATVRLGNNSARDFLYAGDAVRLAVELLERGAFGEVYNLGSESSVRIYDLAQLIGKVMDFADVKVEQDPSRVRRWEIWHLQADNRKLYDALGDWKNGACYPLTPLEEALKRTVAWYNKNGRKWPWEG